MDQNTNTPAVSGGENTQAQNRGQGQYHHHRNHRGGHGNRRPPRPENDETAQSLPESVDETSSAAPEEKADDRIGGQSENRGDRPPRNNRDRERDRDRSNRGQNNRDNRDNRDNRGNRNNRSNQNRNRTNDRSELTTDPNADNTSELLQPADSEVLQAVSEADAANIPAEVLTGRPEPDAGPQIQVVGIQFNDNSKVYYFDPGEKILKAGSYVIVDTARGPEFGEVIFGNRFIPEAHVVQPLRPVIRLATEDDLYRHAENLRKEGEAFKIGLEQIARHGLDMKLVAVQYAFDRSKLLFYFTSAGRVDFRELVKDLASIFRTRIELRQIGIRDEAKMLGGIGACGRPLCCSAFLPDFAQVSIKMAKEQNLSLNSTKVSGTCGRLMCCLNYEYETYVDASKRLPPIDSTVRTPDGDGRVVGVSTLAETVKVSLPDKEKDEFVIKEFPATSLTVLSRGKKTENEE